MKTKAIPTAEKVLELIKEGLSFATNTDFSSLNEATVLFDEGLDSLDLVETEMYLEDIFWSDFDVEIDFNDVFVHTEETTLGSFRDSVLKELEKACASK